MSLEEQRIGLFTSYVAVLYFYLALGEVFNEYYK